MRDIGKVSPGCQERPVGKVRICRRPVGPAPGRQDLGAMRSETCGSPGLVTDSSGQPLGFIRQSWKPSVEAAWSMALRLNLCGGVSREFSVPVSPQGAYLAGSLVP